MLYAAALVSLTFGIVRRPKDGWASPCVLSLLGGTVLLLGAFVAVELRRPHRMLELSLFRYPRLIGVQLLPVATGFTFIALIVYIPIWFIVIQGRDAFTAGLAILPLTAPMLVVPLLAGRMAQYVSPGLLSGVGILNSALDAWLLMGLSPAGSAILMLLIGIGNGLPWGLVDALSVDLVPKERAGMATGIFTTMRVAGEAIAIAAIGAVLVGLAAVNLRTAAKVRSIPLPQSATAIASQLGSSGGHGTSTGTGGAVDGATTELAHSAYTSAFHSILGVLAILTILTAEVCIVTLGQSSGR